MSKIDRRFSGIILPSSILGLVLSIASTWAAEPTREECRKQICDATVELYAHRSATKCWRSLELTHAVLMGRDTLN